MHSNLHSGERFTELRVVQKLASVSNVDSVLAVDPAEQQVLIRSISFSTTDKRARQKLQTVQAVGQCLRERRIPFSLVPQQQFVELVDEVATLNQVFEPAVPVIGMKLTAEQLRRGVVQLSVALHEFHKATGRTHGLLSPRNIFMGADGGLLVGGFQTDVWASILARSCKDGNLFPAEPYDKATLLDPRYDSWFVGSIVYYLQTGQMPYDAATTEERVEQIWSRSVDFALVPDEKLRLLARSLMVPDIAARPDYHAFVAEHFRDEIEQMQLGRYFDARLLGLDVEVDSSE